MTHAERQLVERLMSEQQAEQQAPGVLGLIASLDGCVPRWILLDLFHRAHMRYHRLLPEERRRIVLGPSAVLLSGWITSVEALVGAIHAGGVHYDDES